MAHQGRNPKMPLRSLLIDLAGNCFFIALNTAFLVAFAPESNMLPAADSVAPSGRICEENVRTYLIGQLVLYIIYSLPQRPLQYYIENYNPELRRNRAIGVVWSVWSLLTLFDIIWFIVGQVWVFKAELCKKYDAPLYWLAVAEIVFFYLSAIVPIFLYTILVIVSRRRYLQNQMTGGTGPAAHLKGGLSKAELATLRTFVFRTSMAVSPEENEHDEEKGIPAAQEVTELAMIQEGSGEKQQVVAATGKKVEGEADKIVATAEITESEDSDSKRSGKQPMHQASAAGTGNSSVSAQGEAEMVHAVKPVESDLPEGASTNCAICFCDFEPGDVIRELACLHIFHSDCIDPWLIIPEADPATQATSSTSTSPPKAHRTCPLCVREAILPEFRDPAVEQAMELQKKEDAEMARLLERLKKEAEEEQQLIESRKKRAELKKQRRANGFGAFLNPRGRSKTETPQSLSSGTATGATTEPEQTLRVKRSASANLSANSDSASAVSATVDAAAMQELDETHEITALKERFDMMKARLESIQTKLHESGGDDGRRDGDATFEESVAAAKMIEIIIDSVQSELVERENAALTAALEGHIDEYKSYASESDEKTDGSASQNK
ncbi:hypothetical protein CcCBS67573_g06982 [Chytriomyces confervae]|uniref:RING-type E3 ubiquitin transferase n=1 Tax=Chytriomyces confervae TaxID=246404 RepID=A0A507EY61_9FUNG|nr:hypothetical protein CcCBS67573_g06982 [Chytriomyces confervae]